MLQMILFQTAVGLQASARRPKCKYQDNCFGHWDGKLTDGTRHPLAHCLTHGIGGAGGVDLHSAPPLGPPSPHRYQPRAFFPKNTLWIQTEAPIRFL